MSSGFTMALAMPTTLKCTKAGGNKRLKYAVSAIQGYCEDMEDDRPPYEGPLVDGCTACVALIRGNQIIIGNAGDSRCVLSRNGQAVALSTDHKQCLPAERQRIEKARNATVRVRGDAPQIDDGISTSRSIGDLKCKQNISLFPQDQILIAFPEVQSVSVAKLWCKCNFFRLYII
ncbi:hypothetical protein SETIT_2G258800v2 [Setaria italica]|uniref:protein-serine/threonine phosphatase n=1 Tax=Setaria italica TaxID=4555 RepID=A0A368Q4Z6_SETIT|nr:hypothetical protein SETIT_2G258800v2 [Setaria italica]